MRTAIYLIAYLLLATPVQAHMTGDCFGKLYELVLMTADVRATIVDTRRDDEARERIEAATGDHMLELINEAGDACVNRWHSPNDMPSDPVIEDPDD
ncbi:MAG: hypothetical protein OXH09_07100 [Gammaproteobacteria bacterium]|nr:hypothetical protein [Gammaproteobacteria bacterium]